MISFAVDAPTPALVEAAPLAVNYGLPPPADPLGRSPSSPLYTALPIPDPTQPAQATTAPSRVGLGFTLVLVVVLVVFAFRRR